MKSIMTSVSPHLCGKITSGKCKILVRKSAPKEVPFKAFIYCTRITDKKHCSDEFDIGIWKGNEHLIGEFVCDKVEVLFDTNGNPENYMTDILPSILQKTALSYNEFAAYVGSRADKNSIYGWYISDLKIYDEPKALSEFFKPCSQSKNLDCDWLRNHNVCSCSNKKPVTRPPQSWCYVEEI